LTMTKGKRKLSKLDRDKIELVQRLLDNAWKAMEVQHDEAMTRVGPKWLAENESKKA